MVSNQLLTGETTQLFGTRVNVHAFAIAVDDEQGFTNAVENAMKGAQAFFKPFSILPM